MGSSVAQHFAHRGDRVAVLDVNGDAAERVAGPLRSNGAGALALQVDVADRAAVDDALAKVRTELGAIEILVTSAAIARWEPFDEISNESWDRVLAVNLTGTFNCLQAALPDMAAAGWGRVVTISPSNIDTPMLRQSLQDLGVPADDMAGRLPTGRLGTGADIAGTCMYLCSDAAAYVTGQLIGVNGGTIF
jgi:NAD(P)-dependent dehydrogenase (short-subunit alcohol dehydrogenase family)